ncbi:unnamed protein product [Effrenium voratum]|nr:unnamed protein product [Effrenium voratum]
MFLACTEDGDCNKARFNAVDKASPSCRRRGVKTVNQVWNNITRLLAQVVRSFHGSTPARCIQDDLVREALALLPGLRPALLRGHPRGAAGEARGSAPKSTTTPIVTPEFFAGASSPAAQSNAL